MDELNLQRVLTGDKQAFEQLYRELVTGLWRYVYSRVRNKEVAEDIVAESFIILYQNCRNIKNWQSIKSYLYRITINQMNKYFKQEKPVNIDLDTVVGMPADWEGSDVEELEMETKLELKLKKFKLKVEEILKNLPNNYAEVLRLRFLSELNIAEVAQVMNISEGNVKVIQNRAIKKAKVLFSSHVIWQ